MATNWRVTAQRQGSNLTPQGTFDDVMEVSFETIPEGVTGLVVIPVRLYEPDYVASQIDARVSQIQAVQAL